MAKLYVISNPIEGSPDYYFDCPGCKCSHGIWTTRENHPKWEFNNDINLPTFNPSILVQFGPDGKYKCHSFVNDGFIQFLNDCTHELVGQIVELPEVE